jgi:hypothetical protein
VVKLIDAHKSQAFNYLNATKFDLALLVNFGHFPKIEYERIANNRNRMSNRSIDDELRSWDIEA